MGHPEPERQNEEESRTGHDGEGGAPRERPREEAAERHADEVGDRHARDHQADVSRGLAGRRETGRHDGAHAEVGAVRKACDESCGEHRPVVEGEGREEVSREDQARQDVEHARERDAARGDHHDGDARTHAERVGGDEVTRLGNRDGEAFGHVREDGHHRELGDPEGERAEREGEKVSGHVAAFLARRACAVPLLRWLY